MKTYWIADRGQDARGPYSVGQVARMWRSGAVSAMSQACLDGADPPRWQPVALLLRGRRWGRVKAALWCLAVAWCVGWLIAGQIQRAETDRSLDAAQESLDLWGDDLATGRADDARRSRDLEADAARAQ